MKKLLSDYPLMLTVDDLAEVLRVSRTTAWEFVHANRVISVRVGRRLRIPMGHLAKLLGEVLTEESE